MFGPPPPKPRPGWVPQEPPSLAGVDRIALDTEGTGLRWWGGDRLVGISGALPDRTTFYLPFGHLGGGNLPEERVKEWAKRELRDITIDFSHAQHDINALRAWGINLEEQNCAVSDCQHWAALLNDHRYVTNLEAISQEYLGRGKVPGIDTTIMETYHAAEVDPYARNDALLIVELREKMWPLLDAEGLRQVLRLEDECIFATCEMEWNGSPLDEEKLDLWLKQSEQDYVKSLWELYKLAGMKVNPASTVDLHDLFKKFDIPVPTFTEPNSPNFGKETFAKEYLAQIDHPVVRLVRRVKRLQSTRAKYLIPYKRDLRRNGVLRYALHQLRTGGENQGDSGTISGRYSSSAMSPQEGVNIQQVSGKKYQNSVKEEGPDWPYKIRELFVPESGLWCSGDADQIEYRLFAHYAKPPGVLAAYAADPTTNYHRFVQKMIEQYVEITYERTKDCNFASLYGAGLGKFAYMVGLDIRKARKLYNAYHNAVPESREIMRTAMRLAENRGYVKTLMGRRARFPYKDFLHAALNRVIQGTAADEMKVKLVLLRKAIRSGQLDFKLRFTVHDEVNGDVPSVEEARKVEVVLDMQVLETCVPLLWTVNAGPNWQNCKKTSDSKTDYENIERIRAIIGQAAGGTAARERQEAN